MNRMSNDTGLKKIRDPDSRFKNMLSNAVDWIWRTDPEWRIAAYSGLFNKIMLFKREDVIGKSIFEFMDPEHRQKYRYLLHAAAEKKQSIRDIDVWFISGIGRSVCMRINAIPLAGQGNKIAGYQGIGIDVTDRRRYQDELENSNYISRVMTTHSSDCIIFETDGLISYANERALEALGFQATELVGEKTETVIPPETLQASTTHTLEAGQTHDRLDTTLQSADDEILHVKIAVCSLYLNGGTRAKLVIFRDVTDDWALEEELEKSMRDLEIAKSMEEKNSAQLVEVVHELDLAKKKAEEASRFKSEFLSMVSHELKTPLAVMHGGISLCLDGLAGELTEVQTQVLTDTLVNNERLTRLITDLLDVSKIEAGKINIRRTEFDLTDLIQQIKTQFSSMAGEKDIHLELNTPQGPLKVNADKDKIIQIFSNLLSNAIRFTGSGGRIRISAASDEEPGYIRCSVEDNGIGIAEKNLDKLFSKFEQCGKRKEDSSGYQGTGLGLFIVKALVEKHGGRIWVESKLEQGSKFHFTFNKTSGE